MLKLPHNPSNPSQTLKTLATPQTASKPLERLEAMQASNCAPGHHTAMQVPGCVPRSRQHGQKRAGMQVCAAASAAAARAKIGVAIAQGHGHSASHLRSHISNSGQVCTRFAACPAPQRVLGHHQVTHAWLLW